MSPLEARIYRWVDDAGVVHYSTTPPPSAAERELRILDEQGRQRQVRPAPPTAEDREREAQARERERMEAEQRAEEQARQRAEAAALEARVRQLHASYASADEIRQQRDRRLAMVENTLRLSERQETTLQSELERIAAQLRSNHADAQSIDRYRAELADIQDRIQREWAFQRRQLEVMNEIRAEAEVDIGDYERYVAPGGR